jgi:copper(I)-binding protein
MSKALLARLVALLSLVFIAGAAHAHGYKLGDLEIGHPWARATPQGADVAGGFLTIDNEGATPDRLLSVTVAGVDHCQIHEMSMANGTMKMRPLEGGLEIPAKSSVELKPGSFHIMMMGLKAPIVAGTKVPGTLVFEKAGRIDVEFKVEEIGATPAPMHNHTTGTTN